MVRRQVLVLVCAALCASYCYSQSSHKPRPTHSEHSLRLRIDTLRNSTYVLNSGDRPVYLRDGQYTFPVDSLAEGEDPPYFHIEYAGQSWVRLNSDSLIDAIVELQCQSVWTGTDLFLIPVLNIGGQPSALKPYKFPSENAEVNDVVQKGAIVSITLTIYPVEGEPVGPTRTVTYRYRLREDHLEQLDTERSSAP